MYVNNGKISSRQTLRLYVFDLMGIATLLLPPYLAKLCGASGIYAIALGTGAGLIYLLYLGWIMKKMGTDMASFLHEGVNVWLGKLVFVLIMLHSILTAGFCAYVFTNLMQYSLVRDSSYAVILLIIVAVAAYAVSGGIESRARVYEVMFWFILVPYVAMMLASVRDFEWVYVESVLQFDSTNLGKGTYLVFLLLTPLFFSLFLIGEKEKNYGRNIVKTISVSVLFSGVILLGSYVLLLGNFGAKSLASLRFPVVTLMSTIQFEGNFLKRMDALMLAVWFFTLFALLNLHLHYGVRMLTELSPKEKKRLQWWQLLLPTVAVFLVAYAIYLDRRFLNLFLGYYSYGAVPFMVVVPAFLVLVRRKK
ncbi:MAG: GerAB/ArcD/ProY family transporter [Agathobacter sp.]|nr:GerAB/ArcD/ProY family transporter [Agathobacter sp.]